MERTPPVQDGGAGPGGADPSGRVNAEPVRSPAHFAPLDLLSRRRHRLTLAAFIGPLSAALATN